MLRNTAAWTVGIVAFTGADGNIMLNRGDTFSKGSKIEREAQLADTTGLDFKAA